MGLAPPENFAPTCGRRALAGIAALPTLQSSELFREGECGDYDRTVDRM